MVRPCFPRPPRPTHGTVRRFPQGPASYEFMASPQGAPNSAILAWEKCDALPPEGAIVQKVSYYETPRCLQGIAPGRAGPSRWDVSTFWWYLVPREPDLDLVIRAPMCAEALGLDGSCLTVYR